MGTRVIGSIPKDKDRAAVLGALSYLDGETVVPIYGDPANGALLVENSGGGGGGGTQYASGTATPSPVTGNALIFDNSGTLEDVSIANPLPVSATFSGSINTAPTFAMNPSAGSPTAAFGLIDASYRPVIAGAGTAGTPVGGVLSIQGVSSGTAVPISGTVTANAGTNLNTSLLALESGGNLASIKTDTDTIAGAVTSSKMQVNVTNASLAVTGTFYQATQPVSLATNTPTLQSGSTTAVTQGTAANLNATVVGTGTFAVQSAQSGSWTVGTTSAAVSVGQQTVSTSAVQISASSTVPTNGILVGALSTNSASIFIGGSGVTTSNGVELQAGSSLPFTANLNTLYIISAASSSDKIWYNVT